MQDLGSLVLFSSLYCKKINLAQDLFVSFASFARFERTGFKFAWYWKQNLEEIYYPHFADLNIFKVSLLHEELK